MRLMSIVTASVMIGATTGLSSSSASAQNYAADGASPVGTFTWTYEPGSNRKSSLVYPNGATASWTYDNRGELTSVQNRHADGSAISTYDYTYDAAGRRISKNDERYGYNARSELTQATSISNPNFHAAYQFDDIGNRETSAEFGIRSGEYTYTANELNQYASIVDENSSNSAAPSDATFTPTYDADGNQTLVKTKTGIWQVTYNAENRPVKWTCGTTNLVMAFDRMGRRVLSEVQVEGTPVKTETYVYDGYTCILRKTTIHTNAVPTTIRDTFIWDPTESVATRPLVWNRVEEKGSSRETHPTAFYFQDGNKNVSDVVSATDETNAHYTYAPFGDCTATGSLAEANPWRFSSEYADDELGCVYYNYRHYEPTTGRWLGRDRIQEHGGINLYLNAIREGVFDVLGLVPASFLEYKGTPDPNSPYDAMTIYSYFPKLGDYYYNVTTNYGESCRNALKHQVDRETRTVKWVRDTQCPCTKCYTASVSNQVSVMVKFDSQRSWVRPEAAHDEALLRHEKTHMRIAEKWAERAQNSLREIVGTSELYCWESKARAEAKNSFNSKYSSEFKSLEEDLSSLVERFDQETNHGLNREKEEQWEGEYL